VPDAERTTWRWCESAALQSADRPPLIATYWQQRVLKRPPFLQRVTSTPAGVGLRRMANRRDSAAFRCALLCSLPLPPHRGPGQLSNLNQTRQEHTGGHSEEGACPEAGSPWRGGSSADGYRALVNGWLPIEEVLGDAERLKVPVRERRCALAAISSFAGGLEPSAGVLQVGRQRILSDEPRRPEGKSPDELSHYGLCVRAGVPEEARRGDKYCRPSPQFLDMMVSLLELRRCWLRSLGEVMISAPWWCSGPRNDADVLRERVRSFHRDSRPQRLSATQELVKMGHAGRVCGRCCRDPHDRSGDVRGMLTLARRSLGEALLKGEIWEHREMTGLI